MNKVAVTEGHWRYQSIDREKVVFLIQSRRADDARRFAEKRETRNERNQKE
jgi:hypothetical protein